MQARKNFVTFGHCGFWATVCKTVRPILSDRCLPVLSICDVDVLWPNGWMDQDKLGLEVELSPGHTVLDGDPAPQKGHSPQFSAHVCCGQTTGWIKMPLGTEVGLGPSDIVLDGDPAPPPKKKGGHNRKEK